MASHDTVISPTFDGWVVVRTGPVLPDVRVESGEVWGLPLGVDVALGKTTAAWDTTLIDSQFRYAPDTSFSAAAKATHESAVARDGAAAGAAVKAAYAARGITF